MQQELLTIVKTFNSLLDYAKVVGWWVHLTVRERTSNSYYVAKETLQSLTHISPEWRDDGLKVVIAIHELAEAAMHRTQTMI